MSPINISIVGKPNVGKSTFFNKIFNKPISAIGDLPGTTKDVISKEFIFNDSILIFHDTGGLKKNPNLIMLTNLLLPKNA